MSESHSTSDEIHDRLDRLYGDAEEHITRLIDQAPAGDIVSGQETICKALAHEDRLRILETLRDSECCACELQVVLDAPQSTVATHLRKLRDAGLVKTRKKGKWTYYRIGDTAAIEVLDLLRAIHEGQ